MILQRGSFGGVVGRKPLVFVFVGPAGSGKGTTWGIVKDMVPGLGVPVSTTTRAPRNREVHEIDGVHYHFVNEEEFSRRVATGNMLEFDCKHGNYYGLQRSALDAVFAQGKDAICDLSIEGAKKLKLALPGQVVAIFVLPSEFANLKERMHRRGTDDPTEVATRIKTAQDEINRINSEGVADYLLVNAEGQLPQSLAEAAAIITAERLRFSAQGFNPEQYLGADAS